MRAVVVFKFVYAACQFVARVAIGVAVNGIKVLGEIKVKLLEIELQQQLSSVPGLGLLVDSRYLDGAFVYVSVPEWGATKTGPVTSQPLWLQHYMQHYR